MKFKEFLRRNTRQNEIFDTLTDPNMLPYILGGLSAGVGTIGAGLFGRKLTKDHKEVEAMKRMFADFEQALDHGGPDSPRIAELLDFMKKHLPAIHGIATNMAEEARRKGIHPKPPATPSAQEEPRILPFRRRA